MLWLSAGSLADTAAIAAVVADAVAAGDALAISGPVGAGKTTFTRGFGEALGVSEPITSPTYTLAHVHECRDGRTLGHLDLYRGAPGTDAELADLAPALAADILVVEWPASAGDPADVIGDRPRWQLRLDHAGPTGRALGISAPDPARLPIAALCAALTSQDGAHT